MKNIEDIYRLSPMQQGILFHDLYTPGGGAYLEQVHFRWRGALDTAALRRAFQVVVDRHPILRTAFLWEGLADPVQVVHHEVELPWDEQDWSALSPGDQEGALAAHLERDKSRGLPLAAAPLFRLSVIRLAAERHRIVWSYHHIILDGWSVALCLREALLAYAAVRRGQPLDLPPPRPYRDYIAWLARQDQAAAERYWRGALHDFASPTTLAVERAQRGEGADKDAYRSREERLSVAATARLARAARQQRWTLSTMVHGAVALLLHRYSGEPEVVFGAVVSGRPPTLAGAESVSGLFINTLPVRARVFGEEPVAEWLRALQAEQLASLRYDYLPLTAIQAQSGVPRGRPLFEAILAMENLPVLELPSTGRAGVDVDEFSRMTLATGYPLTFIALPGEALTLQITYDERRFDDPAIARMLRHLEALLLAIAEEPARPVAEVPILSGDERRRILVEWSEARADPTADRSIHELFEEQAAKTPEAVAVVFAEQQLTYRELHLRADRLARRLRAEGVVPEALVGLCVERSLELVIGVLAILQAGGAYLPLDPTYPRERLAFMLDDARPAALLTTAALASRLPDHALPTLLLDAGDPAPSREGDTGPLPPARPDDLAYVIYTSGSTGVPKGVLVTHAHVVRLFRATEAWFRFDARDVWTLFHSYAFDFSVWEIWGALLHGGRLVVVPFELSRAPEAFHRLLGREGVTVLNQTPSAFRQLVTADAGHDGGQPLSLRLVIFGGEAVDLPSLAPWFARHGDERPRLVNMYGITETTVHVTYRPLCAADVGGPSQSPIGRPIPDLRAFVLDGGGGLTPAGVPGELYVGGAGVARGYLRRPELTSARFVPDPFGGAPGARLYRTGDRCRWLPDGNLEYLGRLDHQVKIRGFRVEVGEIESVLAKHPALQEVVVIAREDAPGDRRLVAYVVAGEGSTVPGAAELRSHLQRRLPEHMIPPVFVPLAAMPLTPSGKVDRRALPAPDALRPDAGLPFVAPRTETEEALARTWAALLRVERVGVDDDFFSLGGDSILAIQVVSRARKAGLDLSVRQLFQHRTIAALTAAAVEATPAPVEQGPVTGSALLTPIQRAFFERGLADPHHYNQALLLATVERIDPALLARAVQAIERHHDALRLRFHREGGEVRQVHAGAGEPPVVTTLDRSASDAPERAIEAAAADLQAGLRLDTGPLVRVGVVDLGPERPGRVLLVIHHLVVDGVSWRILVEDLESAYRAAQRGAPAVLPLKTTSFQRWAEQLAAHARSEAMGAEAVYWCSLAAGAPLPRDRASGDDTVAAARTVVGGLDAEETRALLQDVPEAYRTQVNDVLLAALLQALVPWTGGRSLRLDLEGHGREDLGGDVDVSRTVGWFTTVFPVVLEMPDGGPSELLKAVKETLRGVPQRGLGYGLLRHLRGDADVEARLRSLPPAELCFNYLGQVDQGLPPSSLFTLAGEPSGPTRSPRGRRAYLLEVDAQVAGGALSVCWTYSESIHERSTIEALSARFLAALRELGAHCRSPGVGGRTPSDFQLTRLTQAAVDRLVGTGRDVEDVYPLSPMQQGLLLHSLREPGSGVYVEQISFRLRGALAVPALRAAWQGVLDRHAVLRTSFAWEDLDEPVQIVQAAVPLPWTELDWRDLSEAAQEERLAAFLRDDRARGFELSAAPLMRFVLVRLAVDVHQLVWSHHHALLDGWSLPLLFTEVFARHEAVLRGEATRFLPARPYRDYIAWLGRQDAARAEAFWRRVLAGFTSPTLLALERPRAVAAAGATPPEHAHRFSAAATAAIERFARAHGLTLSTLAQGAWALLLGRYSGEDDVVFGATVSGRASGLDGMEAMVGLFINTLPVRARMAPDETALRWLARLQEQHTERLPFEHVPLVRVQGWSEAPRGQALFESIVVVENYPVDEALRRGSTRVEITDVHAYEQTNYPLTVAVVPGRELRLRLSYAADRFEATAIARMSGHFQVLLEGIVAGAVRPLSEIPLLTTEERHQALVTWNEAPAAPAPGLVHERIAEHARRAPERLALVFTEQQMTYGELDRRSGALASHLRSLGVGPEVRVGVCVERSLDLVVALLAVLRAGGAYLPLDVTYPRERLAFMLADARSPVLVTQRRLLGALGIPGDDALRVVCLDEPLVPGRDAGPSHPVHPDNLAYVIYTSGSTGQPKGVENRHGGLANLVRWFVQEYALGPGDRVAQQAVMGFDACGLELWPALAAGASVHLADEETRLSAALLASWFASERITVAHLPPVLAEALVDGDLPEGLALRALLTGSDRVQRAPRRAPPFRFANHYGPTEAAILATWGPIHPSAGAEPPPIGRPLPGVRVYLLGSNLEPVPIGVPGELCIGGLGLGRGYARRPDLTAERFLPDPFGPAPGARLYRTGDRARYRPDGVIEFLGRADDQVKIRGYRVELGELEAALGSYPGVRKAAAALREDATGDKRLVGYVVAEAPDGIPAGALRAHLAERLPPFMIPSAFVSLPALPLTPNGKVDRRALPAPDAARAEGAEDGAAPRTPVEELLAGIFAEVLGLARVGVDEDFFALGGHSLLATRVIARVRSVLGADLPLRAIFEAPTVAGLGARVAAARGSAASRLVPPLVPAPHDGVLPLSFAQQRLWFLDQLEPDSPFYNLPAAVRLEGPLDVAALERSLAEIVRRHEVLRTRFTAVNEQARQEVLLELALTLPVLDLAALAGDAQEAEVRRHAEAEAQRPFRLAEGPLLRAQLLRLGAREHVLLFTMHHIVSDGWSMGVLVREIGALYPAFAASLTSPLPALPLQYADYAVWQRRWLTGERLDEQLAYWKQQLAGVPVLELPTDRPRPAVQTYRGATHAIVVRRELAAALSARCRRENVTLFMTLLAAFQVLLGRYTGQDDLAVGAPIAGRTRTEVEGLIGFFVNTLVLRADLSGAPTFRALLGRVREVTLGAYAHQDVPFEKLVEELAPARDLARSPLFQVVFALQNAPVPRLSLPGLTLEPVAVESVVAKFDLSLSLGETPRGVEGALEYNTDLFDAATVARLAGHLGVLLDAVVADPGQHIDELPILTAEERHQALVTWNDAPSPPVEGLVHERIAEHARRAPERLALVFTEQQMTYGELDRRSGALASHLRSLGVGPEVRVGVCVERSLDLVVALLAVLRAGGAYLPLDVTYPRERLAFMLADARSPVLVTQRRLLGALGIPGDDALRVVCLDEPLVPGRDAGPSHPVHPDNLAYVIYTSGSTGQPKGVENRHGGLANLVRWFVQEYALGPGDRVAQQAVMGFDACGLELWPALAAGASVHLADEETRLSAALLASWFASERITVAHLPPVLAEALVDGDLPEGLALRALLTGSDRVQRAPRRAPPFRFANHYGPTEAAILATWGPIHPSAGAEPPPIGRPLPGVRVYLLGSNLEPVPIGVPGELCIGGLGLGRGYARRPDLTAERFLPDPFGPAPGARLYRTGDRARYRPDGVIEFLGRADDQVKIRGYRVELGELEAALGSYPGVRKAAAALREDATGDKRLVGYVVAEAPDGIPAGALRAHLAERLPPFMIPSAFVSLPALPLTPNGKVDRRALPAPDAARAEGAEDGAAPRTPVEELLAGIFAEVLGLARVGVDEDFFALGGHSLLATRVIARVRSVLGADLPLRAIFEAPTVAGLGARVAAARGSAASRLVPPLVPAPHDGVLPLSFAQQRLWFLDQLEPDSPLYNLPAVVRLEGPLDVAALEQSLTEIVRRHEALRTRFPSVNGQARQEVLPELALTLPVLDLAALAGDAQEAEVRRHAEAEAQRPFRLAEGPLLRAQLLRLGAREHVLLFTMHHIVSDGWSMGVLVREIGALYTAFAAGRPSPLPELPLQYADYAVWQRRWLAGEVLDEQLAYWRLQLTGVPVLELPTDRPRPAVQSYHGAAHGLAVPSNLTAALAALCRRENVTLFMTLLAAFQTLLHRYTGQDDLAVGSPIAGRTRTELEVLIGFFVNTLVLRADLSGAPTFRALLGRVREVTLGAYAHQDVPFEKLVEELAPARDLARSPLFQVMFALQNAPMPRLSLPELTLEPVAVDSAGARFDLTLSLGETPRGLEGALEYNTDLFDAATIARLAGHLGVLLEAVVDDPGRRVDELPLLTPGEQHRLLVEWNQTDAPYPFERGVHDAFEAQTAETPDAVAVVFEEQALTYRELNRRANRLAHHLCALGVGPEVLVGICAERSFELVIGLLGILKAGGAYVPLDPTYPEDRIAFMLADADPPVLLTQQRLAAKLPAHRARLVLLDAPLSAGREDDPPRPAPGDALAYVIYTSGSTGRPKGAMNTHRGLTNRLRWMQEALALAAGDAVLQKTSISFDVSVWELFWPLMVGARLVVARSEGHRDSAYLAALIAAEGVTTVHFVPSMLQPSLDALGACTTLRRVICSGEALPFALAERFFARSDAELWNLYGPTEASIDVTYHRCRPGDPRGLVPIGRPIANTQIYVLDARGCPAPVGVPGELYIGGVGVARGYLNRPEQTEQRFLPDPFRAGPGARLYRTGDRCRWLPDGSVEYLGRLDHQVKIRGLRIELGEIESVLAEHAAVRAAVVSVREDVPGDARLVAYVVGHDGAEAPGAAELRRHLQQKLPEPMIPAVFVGLDALPLTPNGKIDRATLPAPGAIAGERPFVAPRTSTEAAVAAVWQEVLGAPRVGVDDDFFALGGHSLLAAQVMARLARDLGIDLPLRMIFELKTVAALAEVVDAVVNVSREAARDAADLEEGEL